jgi:hypothetical protein
MPAALITIIGEVAGLELSSLSGLLTPYTPRNIREYFLYMCSIDAKQNYCKIYI